jgi:hypothetical protein
MMAKSVANMLLLAIVIVTGFFFLISSWSLYHHHVFTEYNNAVSAALSASTFHTDSDGLSTTNMKLRNQPHSGLLPFYNSNEKDDLHSNVGTNYTMEQAIEAMVPLWSCHSSHNKNNINKKYMNSTSTTIQQKLAFVHIFKTAGSTIRFIFQQYSKEKCIGQGWALITRCSHARAASIQSGTAWKPCHLKEIVDRQGNHVKEPNDTTVTNKLLSQNVNMFGGHIQLGSGDYLEHSNVRYMTFLRHPLSKLASAAAFTYQRDFGRPANIQVIVDKIKTQVRERMAAGQHSNGFFSYLMTPDQTAAEAVPRQTPGRGWLEHVDIVKRNLVHYNVVCGLVENMPKSFEILAHILDSEQSLQSFFRTALEFMTPAEDTTPNGTSQSGRQQPGMILNKSAFSTIHVLEELKKDEEFFELLKEHVKYEQMIYDFGVNMHNLQYSAISS